MSKLHLSDKAKTKLKTELTQTTGFSLSVVIHNEIKATLEEFTEDNIEKLFTKHQGILKNINVSSLEDLKKV